MLQYFPLKWKGKKKAEVAYPHLFFFTLFFIINFIFFRYKKVSREPKVKYADYLHIIIAMLSLAVEFL